MFITCAPSPVAAPCCQGQPRLGGGAGGKNESPLETLPLPVLTADRPYPGHSDLLWALNSTAARLEHDLGQGPSIWALANTLSGIFSWLIALITLLVLGPTILNCQKETAPDFH